MASELREIQLTELSMLKDVAAFCDKNDIHYYLSSGSLLGAARHAGFIPWDDDIDICMDAKDYRQFVKRGINGELGEKYFVQNFRTDRKFFYPWTQLRLNGTTSVPRDMLHCDIHYGICMDIFVISQYPKGKIRKWLQRVSTSVMNILIEKYWYRYKNLPMTTKRKILTSVVPEVLRVPLLRLCEYFAYVEIKDGKECFNMDRMDLKNPLSYPVEIMDKKRRTKIHFEDDEFWTFGAWERYLEIVYGDWKKLPPVDQRGGHGDIIFDVHRDYKEYQKELP